CKLPKLEMRVRFPYPALFYYMKMKKIVYECQYASEKIKIDGILDEASWKMAENLEFFIPVTLETPHSITTAKLLYDEKYLYAGFKCYDDDIRATYTKRDSFTWEEDVVEIFLKTSIDEPSYYEFEFSPIKTIFDAFIPGPEHLNDILACAKWNCEGIMLETHIEGTVNDTSDIDTYWSIEIAIPFISLPTLKGRVPEKGEKWVFHLARYDYSKSIKLGRELSSTARLTTRNFHNLNDAQILIFR
ncbi:MAG TPA: carbohydrate-binding family 9-like protein, partial [bacterium]|nr:carbohydrate-binding family 9-like protein [bacterium]